MRLMPSLAITALHEEYRHLKKHTKLTESGKVLKIDNQNHMGGKKEADKTTLQNNRDMCTHLQGVELVVH